MQYVKKCLQLLYWIYFKPYTLKRHALSCVRDQKRSTFTAHALGCMNEVETHRLTSGTPTSRADITDDVVRPLHRVDSYCKLV
ncbi:MAG: hypothetical protein CDV28_15812 [Candidatus Electronema aureum]|uniref:Uncharacterized protein n=1 Tax=Candidatus Electronema aureum TaxID=2005002 RepID=A0A521FYI5_9BACT|nr:MAG: hypothetical protein CDV28_15812 [Candidatus Electronema aureum]